MANQRLNATITIGAALAATFSKTVGTIKQQLGGIGRGIGGLEAAQNRVGAAMRRNDAAIENARGGVLDAVGAFYALKGAIAGPVMAAAEFESAMADIKKVVDFPTPVALDAFQKQLVDLSKTIPTSVTGLAEIAAAAGQAGVKAGDLIRFTEAAAKIGVAFDITADEAGTAMAKLSTGLGITLDETILLADAMNHLSNAQASGADEILDVVRRVGAQGKQFGFTAEQTAAFASAMISAGAQSEVAATSFANMGRALTRGGSATKRQGEALDKLGLNATDVAKRMQKDAVGTTIDVMERISKLPKEMQAAVSSDLFGDDARALGPLLTNLDLVRESLGLVGDQAAYAGSAFKEFEVRNKTFNSKLQRFKNTWQALSITIGDALLPVITQLMDKMAPVIEQVADFVDAHPDLVANTMMTVGALIAFKGAMAGITFIGLLGKGGALSALSLGLSTVGRAAVGAKTAASSMIGLQTALAAMSGQSLGTLGKIGAGLRGMVLAVPGVGALGSALSAIGAAIATVSAPVWGVVVAAVVAIAAAGVTIWKYWDRISAIMSGVGQAVGEILAPEFEKVRPILDWFAPLGDLIAAGWEKAGAAISAVGEWLGSVFTQEVLSEDERAKAKQSGYDFVMALWDGMKQVFNDLVAWVQTKVGELLAPIKGLRDTVKSYLPSFGGAEGVTSDPMGSGIPMKAVGGAFNRGPVIVGERGPELRFENRAGFIATNRQMHDMAGLADRVLGVAARGAEAVREVIAPQIDVGGITIHAAQGMDPRAIADEVMRRLRDAQRGALYDGIPA